MKVNEQPLSMKYILTTPCNELNLLPDFQKSEIAEMVVNYYHDKGFPYFDLTDMQIINIINYLEGYDINNLIQENNELQQNMMGLDVCNMFHPHMWDIQCRKGFTPKQTFENKDKFKKALLKRMKYSDRPLAVRAIRSCIRTYTGTNFVSNFRPTIAKYMYEKYANNGNVLDPCMGFGGRLLGAMCSKITSYEGCDPAIQSFNGNRRLNEKLLSLSLFNKFPQIKLNNICYEDFHTLRKYDLIFTSPPYFDVEKYSEESTQSYIRYPSFDEWVNGFLTPLIVKSKEKLKTDGYFALNVHGDLLIENTLKIANAIFGKPIKVYGMRLSKMMGTNRDKTHKIEPIYIWQNK